jgi:hypothetical protein
MEDSKEPAIVCNPQALSSEEWAAHRALTKRLFTEALMLVQEEAQGYCFMFSAEELLPVATFIAQERRCCPFFTFMIEAQPTPAKLRLHIMGSAAAKAIIAEALLPLCQVSGIAAVTQQPQYHHPQSLRQPASTKLRRRHRLVLG